MGYVSTPAYMSRDDARAAGEQPLLLDGLEVRRYEIPAAGGVIQLVVEDEGVHGFGKKLRRAVSRPLKSVTKAVAKPVQKMAKAVAKAPKQLAKLPMKAVGAIGAVIGKPRASVAEDGTVQYADEDGNPITREQYDMLMAQSEQSASGGLPAEPPTYDPEVLPPAMSSAGGGGGGWESSQPFNLREWMFGPGIYGLDDLEEELGFFEALPALIQGVTALGTTAYGAYAARKERKAASADAARAEAAATKQAELAAKQAEAQQKAAEAQKVAALATKPTPLYKNPLVIAGAVVAVGALGFMLWRMRRKG